jgi:hypothetical protein
VEWRRWRITLRAASSAYALGIIAGSGQKGCPGARGGWELVYINWRGSRPYVLGLERERWGYPLHWLRYRHWPEPVWAGMCGKCAPWPCCGATGFDHADDCEGDL